MFRKTLLTFLVCGFFATNVLAQDAEAPAKDEPLTLQQLLERVKEGVFHYMSGKHLDRYLREISFRWNHRIPMEKETKDGKRKITWTPMPVMTMLQSVLNGATGKQKRRTQNNGLAFFYS